MGMRERSAVSRPLSGPLVFMQEAPAASQSAVALMIAQLADPSSGTCDTALTEYLMPFPGHVVAIAVRSTAARTGGTLVVDASIDGTATGLQAQLDADNVQSHYKVQARGYYEFEADERIGVKITTDSSWTPSTGDLVVEVWVEFEEVLL